MALEYEEDPEWTVPAPFQRAGSRDQSIPYDSRKDCRVPDAEEGYIVVETTGTKWPPEEMRQKIQLTAFSYETKIHKDSEDGDRLVNDDRAPGDNEREQERDLNWRCLLRVIRNCGSRKCWQENFGKIEELKKYFCLGEYERLLERY